MNIKIIIIFISIVVLVCAIFLFATHNKNLFIKIKNLPYPGYGQCYKCGASWGWKEFATHSTSEYSGIFLFCVDCDKIVTIEERWEALDKWKVDALSQNWASSHGSYADKLKWAKEIENTEFLEYPRNKNETP